jgi:hypothetical protein
MKYEPTERSEYVNKKHELLLKLGFEQSELYDEEKDTTFYMHNRYRHNLIPGIEFDFSANSIEGIVQAIYKIGFRDGERDKTKKIKQELEIS